MSFQIRPATSQDIPALAKLHVKTFNETHRGGRDGGPSYELRERQWREAFMATDNSWFCFVVEDDTGELVGFAEGDASWMAACLALPGELNQIYALQRIHRQGVGRLLLPSVAHRFLGQGVGSMLLFGEATNPSNGFYEAFGAERLYGDGGEFCGAYGWRDLRLLIDRCDRA